MGKFDFNFDKELTRQLERLENFDEIAPKILNGSILILKKRVIEECELHVRTRTMINSIKQTKAVKNKYGWYVTVRPTGTSSTFMNEDGKIYQRKEPVRNMEIMAHAEYGTSSQQPTPILTKAIKNSESEVGDLMQSLFNEAVNGK